MASRLTGKKIVICLLLVLVMISLSTAASPTSQNQGLLSVIDALDTVATALSDNQVIMLNIWRTELLAASDQASLELLLRKLELDLPLAPVLALPQTQQSLVQDGFFQGIDLLRLALRLAMRPDRQQLQANLAMLRSEYLAKMPQFQARDPGVTPPLVLAMLVAIDVKLAADTKLEATNFDSRMTSKVIGLLFSDERYMPVFNALYVEAKGLGLPVNNPLELVNLLMANPYQLPEFSMIRAVLYDNHLPTFVQPTGKVVAGRVYLQGRIPGGGVTAFFGTAQPVLTDAMGVYIASGLGAGGQAVSFQRSGYLRRLATINIQAVRDYLTPDTLLAGDLDQDGTVANGDLDLLAAGMASGAGEARFLDIADYDGNGILNISDWTMMAKNMGK